MPLLAATIASLAALTLPQQGVLVPGTSLGGIRLGATQAQVRAAWGGFFGRCRGCAEPTWYFTYKRFQPQGAGVSFRGGRVDAVFTLWSPTGWRTSRGVRIGENAARILLVYGALPRVSCGIYYAYVQEGGRVTTAFYVFDDVVWGFGLSSAGAPVCR